MKRLLIYLSALLLISAVQFSQTVDSISAVPAPRDSLVKNTESKLKFTINPYVKQDFNYFLNQNLGYQKYFNEYQFDPYKTSTDSSDHKLSKSELIRIRQSMNKSFSVFRQGELKRDLGVFGQVLGYGQAAAVLGLAVYHIYKYGLK